MEQVDFDIFAGPKPSEIAQPKKEIDDSHAIINAILHRLSGYFTHPDVEEICINKPGEIWLRRRRPKQGEDIWNHLADSDLTFEYLEKVCRMIANANGVPFGTGPKQTPAVYAALPGGHRFTAAMYGNIVYDEITSQGGCVMAIRQAPREDSQIEYSHYGLEAGITVKAPPRFKEKSLRTPDSLSKLKAAVDNGSHLIVSGATSTGKTTLLNRIIAELDPKLRIATIEDTRELVVRNLNRFHIVLSRTDQSNNFNDAKAIDLLTRMTPDIILCGEVSTSNAGTIWELTGSGHGSMMTTIHSEDPEQALKTFVERIRHTQKNIDDKRVIEEMKERFTVIQINRDHNGRRSITAVETFS